MEHLAISLGKIHWMKTHPDPHMASKKSLNTLLECLKCSLSSSSTKEWPSTELRISYLPEVQHQHRHVPADKGEEGGGHHSTHTQGWTLHRSIYKSLSLTQHPYSQLSQTFQMQLSALLNLLSQRRQGKMIPLMCVCVCVCVYIKIRIYP